MVGEGATGKLAVIEAAVESVELERARAGRPRDSRRGRQRYNTKKCFLDMWAPESLPIGVVSVENSAPTEMLGEQVSHYRIITKLGSGDGIGVLASSSGR